MSYWLDGEFVLENYLMRTRVAVTPALMQVLHDNPGPSSVDELRAAFTSFDRGDEILSSLLRHNLYLSVGSPAAERDRRVRETWIWGAVAQWFHFATRDTPFEPDIDAQRRWLEALAIRSPAPAPFLRRQGLTVALEEPMSVETASLGRTLDQRRTSRKWVAAPPVRLAELSTVLALTWGTRKIVEESPIGTFQLKTSPSGGARHSIEVYPVVMRVDGIRPGVYHYSPDLHQLTLLRPGSTDDLARQAVNWFAQQPWVADAAAVFLMTSVLGRSMWKYRHPHAYRVLLLDAGHVGQTFHLVCTALGLGPFTSSGLSESAIEQALDLDGVTEIPLYAAAMGRAVER